MDRSFGRHTPQYKTGPVLYQGMQKTCKKFGATKERFFPDSLPSGAGGTV